MIYSLITVIKIKTLHFKYESTKETKTRRYDHIKKKKPEQECKKDSEKA